MTEAQGKKQKLNELVTTSWNLWDHLKVVL